LSGLGGSIRVYSNSGMTDISHPGTNEVFTQYEANNCDLGYIDFTVFSGANDEMGIRLDDNNMTVTEVNHILVDLDTIGWIDGVLDISGSNAAPDGSSGGYDGTTAVANLIINGWTVTTS